MTLYILLVLVLGALVLLGSSVRVVTQFERGVVLRFGRLSGAVRGPGLTVITPLADRLNKVNMQIVTMPVPAQEGITRDNVTVRVDAVVYSGSSIPCGWSWTCRTTAAQLRLRGERPHAPRTGALAPAERVHRRAGGGAAGGQQSPGQCSAPG
jgi:hypothetical protein